MKNKVVVFTQNNARILVNPQQIDIFYKRHNALVNPDLMFVDGIDPHYWKLINRSRIPISDAVRLKDIIADYLTKRRSEGVISRERVFYHTLLKHVERSVEDSSTACFKISELLKEASGIDREKISESVTNDLIINYQDEDLNEENIFYKNMIKKWDQGLIMPMDDEEKLARNKHIAKYGADNAVNIKRRLMDIETNAALIVILLFLAAILFAIEKW